MTSEQFSDSKFKPVAMPMPFGAGNANNYTIPGQEQSAASVNFPDGFPVAYSSPHSGGGKYVTRKEMNGIGNLASRYEFFRRAGGLVTFDSDLSAEIGGYPSGAVLKYMNNGFLYDVISLVDNNTIDFNTVGVDGVNWDYLSVPDKEVFDDVFFEGGSGLAVGTALLAIIKAKKTSPIKLESSISPALGSLTTTYSYASGGLYTFAGCGLMIKDLGSTIPSSVENPTVNMSTGVDWKDWKSLSGAYTALWSPLSSSNLYFASQEFAGFLAEVTKDHYYALSLFCESGDWKNNDTSHVVTITKYSSLVGSVKILYS